MICISLSKGEKQINKKIIITFTLPQGEEGCKDVCGWMGHAY
jgi:hypothetical protein